jgi:hypothetical protein
MILLVKFNKMWFFLEFLVIRVLFHDMQINNILTQINLTHTLRKFQTILETPKIFIIPFVINLQIHLLD